MRKARTRPAGKGDGMSRRELIQASVAGGIGALATTASAWPQPAAGAEAHPAAFDLEEATLAELQEAIRSGRHTARSLTETYLGRIEAVDRGRGMLASVLEVNPDALAIADALDAERRGKGTRGPLHGIPVLIKDNIATRDRMMTTAGSLALVGAVAPRDSFVAERLREAGAVILGKTNLSEWANFRSSQSSSGWSGRGGQCKNPYALDRSPCGSSSGTGAAVAANLAAIGVGTETDGSVVCPSHACSLVGIKPTVGLIGRSGIVPISHTQDTAGPMARTVADAALLLAALAGVDPRDPATAGGRGRETDYSRAFDPKGLAGARLGVARAKFFGYSPEADALVEKAIAVMKESGAVIVDPADIPHAGEYDEAELDVLLFEFKADLNAYLAEWAPGAPVRTLADVIAFNAAHADREMPYFGQDIMEKAEKKGPLTDKGYLAALAKCRKLSRKEGLDAVMGKHRLDAIVAPTGSPAWMIDLVDGDHFLGASSTPAAVSGYPSVTVPCGYAFGIPVGVSFIGRAWGETRLITLAYAFEQATKARRPPRLPATADLSRR
jgi:amidase